jgi:hypothetical protein
MEIDKNDRHPPNSILIKLSKAFDGANASKKDPNRPILYHWSSTVHTEQQTDERPIRIDKKVMVTDQSSKQSNQQRNSAKDTKKILYSV